jgi:hypothetical protein
VTVTGIDVAVTVEVGITTRAASGAMSASEPIRPVQADKISHNETTINLFQRAFNVYLKHIDGVVRLYPNFLLMSCCGGKFDIPEERVSHFINL